MSSTMSARQAFRSIGIQSPVADILILIFEPWISLMQKGFPRQRLTTKDKHHLVAGIKVLAPDVRLRQVRVVKHNSIKRHEGTLDYDAWLRINNISVQDSANDFFARLDAKSDTTLPKASIDLLNAQYFDLRKLADSVLNQCPWVDWLRDSGDDRDICRPIMVFDHIFDIVVGMAYKNKPNIAETLAALEPFLQAMTKCLLIGFDYDTETLVVAAY